MLIKNKEPLILLAVLSQLISIIFSFQFYFEIGLFFAVIICLFELTMFFYVAHLKGAKNGNVKRIMMVIVLIICCFSVLGVVANGYNIITTSSLSQFKESDNPKYNTYLADKKVLEEQIKNYNEQIKSLDLDSQTSKLKSWEDKSQVVKDFNNSKSELQKGLNNAIKQLANLKEPDTKLQKRVKTTGYSAILEKIAGITGIADTTFILVLTIIIAIVLQLIILTSRLSTEKVRDEVKIVRDKKLGTEKLGTEKLGTEKLGTKKLSTEKLSTEIVKYGSNHLIPSSTKKLSTEKLGTKKLGTEKLSTKKLGTEIVKDEVKIVRDKKLSTEIEKYIENNFEIEDTILSKKLMEDLNLTERQWRKIRNEVVNIKKYGTKFKRSC